jgi:hypothetical protein|tara:strand:- start:6330 stop:6503 length:174 start_codon:yes stop_codon:yes gene_type:complete
MSPALSAPDLQCITIGYSISLNNFFAAKIVSTLGVSREVTGKFINFILLFSQVSFSK